MKVKLANLAPRAINQAPGRFYIRDTMHGPVAQAWPTKGKRKWTERERQYQKRFGIAASMASQPQPLEYQTAVEMAKGTEQVPRDILTMAALGTYYMLQHEDGTPWARSYGPLAYQRPEKGKTMWEWSLGDSAWTTPNGTANSAFKGNIIIPPFADVCYGVRAIFTTVAGAQYKAAHCVLNASNVIQSVTLSGAQVSPGAGLACLEFDIEFELAAGVRNAILVGRTNGIATSQLLMFFATAPRWHWPVQHIGLANYNTVSPAVGQSPAAFVATSCYPLSALFMQ